MAAEVKGVSTVLKNMDIFKNVVQDLLGSSMQIIGKNVLAESNKIIPYDTGFLMRSGYCTSPIKRRGKIQITIGYTAPYAAIQHEDISLKHKNGRQAKFLQTAMNNQASTLDEDLVSILRKKTRF